jgi:hypothetical protein
MPPTPSPETIARLSSLAAEESDYQLSILKARAYHEGRQFVKLTERLREFLGGTDVGSLDDSAADADRLRVNVTRIVTTAVTERLLVSGFDSNEQGIAEPITDETGAEKTDPLTGEPLTETVKPVAAYAWQIWQANRMDAKQARVHLACCRDSEAFVIVDWDNVEQRPRFTPHVRYVDQSVTTSTYADVGEGCKAFYANDDPDQDLLYVTKRWTEVMWQGMTRTERQRLTVYYPDRIEKYAGFTASWQPIRDEGDVAWPIPWLDKAGAPLGIPVAHFRSTAGMEAREAWPAQNAINYLSVLELVSADQTAFRIFLAFGWKPVDDDGNPLIIEPGRFLGSPNKDARGEAVDPADISPISNLIEGWVSRAAMVTDTPVSRFIFGKQVAAEGTQKQQEGPLVNKVRNRQGEIGNAWEDCIKIALRLANTFGNAGLDDMALIYAKWEPAESRDEGAELDQAAKKQSLGIPQEQIWAELGYSQEKIAQWKAVAEARRQEEMELAAKQPPATNGKAPAFGRG